MTPSDDLQRLVERIEGASAPVRQMDADIARAVGFIPNDAVLDSEGTAWHNRLGTKVPCYTASIDAAMTLVPEGVNIGLHIDHNGNDCAWSSRAVGWQPQVTAGCVTPALALCAAALRARITQEQSNGQ